MQLLKISVGADGGPRPWVCARLTQEVSPPLTAAEILVATTLCLEIKATLLGPNLKTFCGIGLGIIEQHFLRSAQLKNSLYCTMCIVD